MTQLNMDQPPGVAVRYLPDAHVGQVVFTEGEVVTAPPALVDTLDYMAASGGGCLFLDFVMPPYVLLGLGGQGFSDFWREHDRPIPVGVKVGLPTEDGCLVVVLDMTIVDDVAADPFAATVYINPYESQSHEALCRLLQEAQFHLLVVEGRTVRRTITVSLTDAVTPITKDFLINMMPEFAAPSQDQWLRAMARVRAKVERGTTIGKDLQENQ